MFIVDEAAYVRAATEAMLGGRPFETLVDICRREAVAAKVVNLADWRQRLRPVDVESRPCP